MADRTALTANGSSGARQCQQHRRGERQQLNVPAAPDSLAPTRRGLRSAGQQRLLRDAENFGGGVSWHPPSEIAAGGSFFSPLMPAPFISGPPFSPSPVLS